MAPEKSPPTQPLRRSARIAARHKAQAAPAAASAAAAATAKKVLKPQKEGVKKAKGPVGSAKKPKPKAMTMATRSESRRPRKMRDFVRELDEKVKAQPQKEMAESQAELIKQSCEAVAEAGVGQGNASTTISTPSMPALRPGGVATIAAPRALRHRHRKPEESHSHTVIGGKAGSDDDINGRSEDSPMSLSQYSFTVLGQSGPSQSQLQSHSVYIPNTTRKRAQTSYPGEEEEDERNKPEFTVLTPSPERKRVKRVRLYRKAKVTTKTST
ncbi:hypothetical protein F5Y17DRAFT_463128 [Xylariaceae sp. FL0594]|nr:hypothetical protein F5Y17DRAFT_463128 [Xylariaceae sp. FL0594]